MSRRKHYMMDEQLYVTKTGTVSVFYKRTFLQIIGFTLQSTACLLLFYFYLHLTLIKSVWENSV